MHCPRCGHQQSSDEIRFCTKCGLAMNDVKEILNPEKREKKAKTTGTVSRGIRQGLGLMLFGFVLVAILAILHDLDLVPKIFIKIATLVFCLGAAVRMGFAVMSGTKSSADKKDPSPVKTEETNILPDKNFADKALPTAQFYPPIDLGLTNYDTAEIALVPSVTEDTTKRLKRRFELEKD